MDRSGQRLGSGSVGLRAAGLEVAQPRASVAHGRAGIDLGHRESLARAGPRQHATARVDDLGLTEEAQPAEGAGLVGGHPDHLVLGGAGAVDQVELAGLDVAGDEPRRPLGERLLRAAEIAGDLPDRTTARAGELDGLT